MLMALINEGCLKETNKERNLVHKKVEATYTFFEDEKGKGYIQIDTYGSEDRKIKGKVSQSLQFDRVSAKKMITVLKNSFGI